MRNFKNVISLAKFRRFSKSGLVIFIYFIIAFSGSGFTSKPANGMDHNFNSGRDTTDKYGFKALFDDKKNYDPSKPHVTQLNPFAVSYVQQYIQSHGALMERIRIWGRPYLDLYDGILSQYGLPKELKYLSVIESDLKSGAVSVAGAVGPWQIMDFEARRVGLVVNTRSDERVNYFKSTHAAAKILKELYGQFDDWLLVIAAYNCGGGRVRQAIRKSGSRNFWALQNYLPAETRNHVKKFIGTHFFFEGNGGLTTMTASEIHDLHLSIALESKKIKIEKAVATGNENYPLSGRYNSAIIAKNIEMDLAHFNKLNPGLDRAISSGNGYQLKLPSNKMKLFDERKQFILEESLMLLLNNSDPKVLITP